MLAMVGLVAAVLSPAALSTAALSLISLPNSDRPSYDFHNESCPNLRQMVHDAVEEAIKEDIGVVAGLLRVMFHDCFPQSIRVKVQDTCGPTVSCTDIMNLATREAVMHFEVPGYEVPLGLLDSRAPAPRENVEQLPGPDFNATQLIESFQSRGFDITDVVALSGAHTIGRSSCGSFRNRFGENADFVRWLQGTCARNPNHLQDLDVTTPEKFDNVYYNNLKEGKGVLNSDMALTRDASTSWLVDGFAQDQGWFFSQFGTSMRKMAHLPSEFGRNGEIRNPPASSVPPPSASLITAKLTSSNFLSWKAQILPPLHITKATGYVDGTELPPDRLPADDKGVRAPNPEYATWFRQDQIVLSYLLASLIDEILQQIKLDMAIFRKENLSMADYFAKIRANTDQLAAVGRAMRDEDIITAVINGLDSEYEPLITAATTRLDVMTLGEFYSHAIAFERRREYNAARFRLQTSGSSVNYVTRDNNNPPRGNNNNNNRGKGNYRGKGRDNYGDHGGYNNNARGGDCGNRGGAGNRQQNDYGGNRGGDRGAVEVHALHLDPMPG
ncbi:Peroxidase 12 [Triticum urartu]|uniref:Peroxidase 12 n=1 Tax=Triticum urartu TaxID=4572 RepID=M8A859_TRIUA|nr:Peroxidase 12 [Triticum urartu]